MNTAKIIKLSANENCYGCSPPAIEARLQRFSNICSYPVFGCAISQSAKKSIREGIKSIFNPRWSERILESFAADLNPKIRGWINYYTRYNKHEALNVFLYLNELIRKWVKRKFKTKILYLWSIEEYKTIILKCFTIGN